MKQILIVEDDALLNKTLTYNLISDGYNVTSALNAKIAANLLSETEYDLVLLDINLPDGNGYDLCKLIKPGHPDTLVIFLTANDQESDQLRGYEVGAVDTLQNLFLSELYSGKSAQCSLCWNITSRQRIFTTMADCSLTSWSRRQN